MQLLGRKNKALFLRITTYRHTRMDDEAREMAKFEADTNFTFSVQNIGDTEPRRLASRERDILL